MSDFFVRQASLSDMDVLVTLFDEYRQLHGQPSDTKTIKAFLLARFHLGESALFMAHCHAEAVGFAQLYAGFSSVLLRKAYLLSDIYVRPEARRQGLAGRLIRAADDFARAAGAERIRLPYEARVSSLSALRANERGMARRPPGPGRAPDTGRLNGPVVRG